LRVAAGDEDFSAGTIAVYASDGTACIKIRRMRHGASVQNNKVRI
jgi:hypothetical protein